MINVRHIVKLLLICLLIPISASSPLHLAIHRRGGRLATNRPANLTRLEQLLTTAEDRYALTYRSPESNKLVRKWQVRDHAVDDEHLLKDAQEDGSWYVSLPVGTPTQQLEFDLDMLAPDFYTIMTTNGEGSRYDTFASQTHESNGDFEHPLCRHASDLISLGAHVDLRLKLPICMAPKSSSLTLISSDSRLGLGPSGYLSRMPGTNLVSQLHDSDTTALAVWSITVLDAETGILSFGGTIAKEVEEAKTRAETELQHLGQSDASPEWINAQVAKELKVSMPDGSTMEEHFKWTSTKGAAGWWTTLMPGVWINGIKVLRNQPILLDIQCPFILAPSVAASQFYAAIGGAFRLDPPHDMFFAVPCLNRINIAFEIAGWNFPVMSGETTRADSLHGPAGGRFSLGKIGNGTGYCVGSVVETRMEQHSKWAPSGMKSTWVLGEPFFRGMGVAFDQEGQRIGLRSY